MKPKRIQLSRKKGWRMPPNSVKVDRTTKWGNPFKVGESFPYPHSPAIESAKEAVQIFRAYLDADLLNFVAAEVKHHLRGKNLACWCKPGDPCHADVLLEIANK